jgi:hypothetical protein
VIYDNDKSPFDAKAFEFQEMNRETRETVARQAQSNQRTLFGKL